MPISLPSGMARIRHAFSRWNKAGITVAILVLTVVGTRVALPGVAGDVLRNVLRGNRGFLLARFVQSLPGVVANPGPVFIAQTMLLLTTGTAALVWLHTRFTKADDADDFDTSHYEQHAESVPTAAKPIELLLPAGQVATANSYVPRREPAEVPSGRDRV